MNTHPLRRYRSEHGLSRRQVAEAVGVDEMSIGRYERGERMPRRQVLKRLIAMSGGQLTADDFLDGADDA